MIAWGLSNGHWASAGEFAQKARAAGYRAASIEYDDYGNAQRWQEFKDACYAHGLLAGPWFTNGGSVGNTPGNADFTIAELEGPGDYDGIVSTPTPSVTHAIITNFGGLTDPDGTYRPDKAKALIDAGWWCLTECYIGDNPNATKERMEFTATQKLGWPSAQPVYGIYNAPLPADASGGYGVYLAEYEF